jgi:hypothetical protein
MECQKYKIVFFVAFIYAGLEDAVVTSNAADTVTVVRMRRVCTILRPEVA